MISFILLAIFGIWVLINRFGEGGKVEGHPLGMPRGTVRGLSTILLVAFPFGYILSDKDIPSLIVNVIFVVVAFYFEARRSEHDKIKDIVEEMKRPDLLIQDSKKVKMPLYLPRYSVRIILISMLFITLLANYLGPRVDFEVTNTVFDLLIIVILFIIGASFRAIANSREKKKMKNRIANMDASLSEAEIIEKLILEEISWWKRKGRNVLSVTMFVIVVISLICFSFEWDLILFTLFDYSFTLVGFLLLFINAYYGFID